MLRIASGYAKKTPLKASFLTNSLETENEITSVFSSISII
jgi:hypothetical protein